MTSLDACIEQFQHSAFRLETLPSYSVSGEGGLRSLRDNGYLRNVARAVLSGKSWTRLRVVSDPLTAYEREQVERVYLESNACGETIRIARRADVLDDLLDFWLFDGGTPNAVAVLMRFDDNGEWLSDEIVTDPDDLAVLQSDASDLLGVATSLEDFRVAVDA